MISCWTSESDKLRPVAIAGVLADDTSCIITKKSSGIDTLSKLDGKRYASYVGRFEMAIIRQMIIDAGGKGDLIEVNPPKLDCFEKVLNDEADSTWIFLGWEGITASQNGIELNEFSVTKSGVPYGYSPLLLASPKFLEDPKTVGDYLSVTARGYEFAISNPKEASAILFNAANHETLEKLGGVDFVTKATTYLATGNHYIDPKIGKWGYMEPTRWENFINWLSENQLVTYRDLSIVPKSALPLNDMYTNKYFV